MSEITGDEALQAGLQTGIAYVAGGPYTALLAGGLSVANALFSDPKAQAAPRRASLPNEAFTSPVPRHGWSIVGRSRVGGLIVYASSFTQGDNLVLNEAIVVSRGSLADLGASCNLWYNGHRIHFVRQTPPPGGRNPEGGTAAWYEPSGADLGHNLFRDSFVEANGLEGYKQAPVDGDLLFRNEGSNSFVVQQLRNGVATTLYTLPSDLSRPDNVYFLNNSFAFREGDWIVRQDGAVFRWQNLTTLTGREDSGLVFLFSLVDTLEQAGRTWNGIIGNSISWAGRLRFYANFAADGTQGAELRASSRKAPGYHWNREDDIDFVEIENPEWTTNHKLEGYSWIHFLSGRDRSNALTGSVAQIPSSENYRAPRLTQPPGIIFDLPGRVDVDTHPVAVAGWLLGQRGLSAAHLSAKFGQTLTPASANAPDGTSTIKYRYRGLITDDQSTFDALRILEFCAAGHLITDEQGRAWLQQLEQAPDYGEITEDDMLAGVESYDPQGRGLTTNTGRMSLRQVDGLHPLAGDWPLPDVVNNTLLTLDGANRHLDNRSLDDLGVAEGITNYNQGQWRLALHAQQLGFRGRATFRVEATATRSRWLSLGRLRLRTSQWGTLQGYIESTTKLLDGSLQVVMMVGDVLNFTPLAARSYRPLTGDIPDFIGTDSIPPEIPEPFTATPLAGGGGIVIDFTVPPDADYAYTRVAVARLAPDASDDDAIAQVEGGHFERAFNTPHNVLNLEAAPYRISVASVDRSGNQSAWAAPVRVEVRSSAAPGIPSPITSLTINPLDYSAEVDFVATFEAGAFAEMEWGTERVFSVDIPLSKGDTFSSWSGGIKLPDAIAPMETWLRQFFFFHNTGQIQMRTAATETGGGGGTSAGPDLSEEWEARADALIFTFSDGSMITVPGPAHATSNPQDTTEPYVWTPANGAALGAAIAALDNNDRVNLVFGGARTFEKAGAVSGIYRSPGNLSPLEAETAYHLRAFLRNYVGEASPPYRESDGNLPSFMTLAPRVAVPASGQLEQFVYRRTNDLENAPALDNGVDAAAQTANRANDNFVPTDWERGILFPTAMERAVWRARRGRDMAGQPFGDYMVGAEPFNVFQQVPVIDADVQYAYRNSTTRSAPTVTNTQGEQTNDDATPTGWTRTELAPTNAAQYTYIIERRRIVSGGPWTLWGKARLHDEFQPTVQFSIQYAYRNALTRTAPAVVNTQAEQTDAAATPDGWVRSELEPTNSAQFTYRISRRQLVANGPWTVWGNAELYAEFVPEPVPQQVQQTQLAYRRAATNTAPAVQNTQGEQTDDAATPAGWVRNYLPPTNTAQFTFEIRRDRIGNSGSWTVWGNARLVDQFDTTLAGRPPAPQGVTFEAADDLGSFSVAWTSSGSFFTQIEWDYLESAAWHFEDRRTSYAQNARVRTQQRSTRYRFRIRHVSPLGAAGPWFDFA